MRGGLCLTRKLTERGLGNYIVINDDMFIEIRYSESSSGVMLRFVDFGKTRYKIERGEISEALIELKAQRGQLP